MGKLFDCTGCETELELTMHHQIDIKNAKKGYYCVLCELEKREYKLIPRNKRKVNYE